MPVIQISYFRLLVGVHLTTWLFNLQIIGFGSGANQLQKTILFFTAVTMLFTRRVDKFVLSIVLAIFAVTFVAALATSYNDFSFGRYLKSLFSLSAVLLLLPGLITENDRHFILKWFAWSPVACVAIGAMYNVVGLWPLWYQDFLGVSRLQGSTIPSGLGGIGYIGTVAALLASGLYNKKYLLLGAVNLVILALSAARMPFAVAAMCSLVIFFHFHGRSFARLYLSTIVLAMVCVAAYVAIGDKIAARFESESASGRELIWEVLDSVVQQYPYFGIGLGHQINIIPEDVMEKTATFAAHNEYLRLAVETGYVGVTGIMILFAVVFFYMFMTRKYCRNPMFVVIVSSFFIYCYTDNVISSNMAVFVLVMAASLSLGYGHRPAVPAQQPMSGGSRGQGRRIGPLNKGELGGRMTVLTAGGAQP